MQGLDRMTRRAIFAMTLAGMVALATGGDARASLVAIWHFDGNLSEETGTFPLTFNGTASASYVTTSGRTALALDGVDQWATVPISGTALDFNNQSFTIATWLTVHNVPTARREAYVVGRPSTSSNDNYALTIDYLNQTPGTDDDNVIIQSDGYTRKTPSGAASVVTNLQGPTGMGHYINLVLTYEKLSNTLTLYRNGSLRDSVSTNVIGPYAHSSPLRFGTEFTGSTFLRADLDEIQIYDVALTQAQVTALYNSGNNPAPTPEPTGLAGIALGLAAWAMRRQRRVPSR